MAKARKTTRRPGRKVARKAARKVVRKPARKVVRKKAVVSKTTAKHVRAAARLSKAFHGKTPRRVTRTTAPRSQVGMVLGKLEGVIYRTPDGTGYLHKFYAGSQPELCATHDGRQLIVRRGRYRMTARGIVDKRK
jgi:hypothetical protein